MTPFLFVCGFPLLLPSIIGTIILRKFWEDELSRLTGFFTLKPILAYPIWFVIFAVFLLTKPDSLMSTITYVGENLPIVLLAIIPGVLLTIIIVVVFQRVFKSNKFAWLFLLGDVIRWGYTLYWSIKLSGSSQIYYFIGFLLPSIYAAVALFFVYYRHKFRLSSETYLVAQEASNSVQ